MARTSSGKSVAVSRAALARRYGVETPEEVERRQIYTFVQDVVSLARTGAKMDMVIESIRTHPSDFVMWRDAGTGHNVLKSFVDHGHHKVVMALLEEAGKISTKAKNDLLNGEDIYGRTSFDFAMTKGMRTFLFNQGARAGSGQKKLLRRSDELIPGEPTVDVHKIVAIPPKVRRYLDETPECPK